MLKSFWGTNKSIWTFLAFIEVQLWLLIFSKMVIFSICLTIGKINQPFFSLNKISSTTMRKFDILWSLKSNPVIWLNENWMIYYFQFTTFLKNITSELFMKQKLSILAFQEIFIVEKVIADSKRISIQPPKEELVINISKS